MIDRRAGWRHWFEPTGERVKTTESGGVSGFDAGKKIKGRKRHIMTDTLGLLLFAVIHSAGIQDRDGAPDVFRAIRHRFPWLRHVFADGLIASIRLMTRRLARYF